MMSQVNKVASYAVLHPTQMVAPYPAHAEVSDVTL